MRKSKNPIFFFTYNLISFFSDIAYEASFKVYLSTYNHKEKEYFWNSFNKTEGFLLVMCNKQLLFQLQIYLFYIWLSLFSIALFKNIYEMLKLLLYYFISKCRCFGKMIKKIKIVILLIVNALFLLLFLQKILFNDISITNEAILTLNIFKILVLAFFIVIVNILLLYFNKAMLIVSLSILARYNYKCYFSKDAYNVWFGFKHNIIGVVQGDYKATEAIALTEKTGEVVANYNWALWFALGVVVVGGIIFIIWSNQSNSDNISSVNSKVESSLEDINSRLDYIAASHYELNSKIVSNERSIQDSIGYTTDINSSLGRQMHTISKDLESLGSYTQAISEDLNKVLNGDILLKQQTSLVSADRVVDALNDLGSEASSSTEVTMLGLAKIYEVVNGLRGNLNETNIRLVALSKQINVISKYIGIGAHARSPLGSASAMLENIKKINEV